MTPKYFSNLVRNWNIFICKCIINQIVINNINWIIKIYLIETQYEFLNILKCRILEKKIKHLLQIDSALIFILFLISQIMYIYVRKIIINILNYSC